MTRFITLHGMGEVRMKVNPAHLVAFSALHPTDEMGQFVNAIIHVVSCDEPWYVRETPAEIERMIEEPA